MAGNKTAPRKRPARTAAAATEAAPKTPEPVKAPAPAPVETPKAESAAPAPAPTPAPAAAAPAEDVDPLEIEIEAAAKAAETAVLEAETIADRLLDTGLRGLADHLDFLSTLATATSPLDALRTIEDYRARTLDRAIEDSSALTEASLRLATWKTAA